MTIALRITRFIRRAVLLMISFGAGAVATAATTQTQPAAQPTTESLRADVFGGAETAADWWVQFHASVQYARWNDAVALAEEIITSQPAVLVRDPRDLSLYRPARRAIAGLFAEKPPLLAAYRNASDVQAQALLAEFERTENLETVAQMLERFPFASLRGRALRLLADGYLDRCDYARAAAAFAELRATETSATHPNETVIWACKEAASLLQAGHAGLAAEKIAQVRRDFGNLTLDRPQGAMKVSELCSRLEQELGRRQPPPGAPVSADHLRSAAGWAFDFSAGPIDAVFRREHPDRAPVCEPACLDGVVYATNGNELRAVEMAGGRERWRWQPDRPDRYNVEGSLRWGEPLSPTTLRPAVTDRGVLFLRPVELAETVHSVCCLDRATGRLLWQRVAWSDERESVETAPVASGENAFVVVSTLRQLPPERTVVARRAVVCFRTATGEKVWRSPLPIPQAPRPEDTPGTVAGPFVCAASLFVLEDRGPLYCLDAATGEMRWARRLETPEPPAGSKPARPGSGWCVAAKDRVAAVGAGSTRIECLDPDSGRRLWSQDAGADIRWLATDGASLFVAARDFRALKMSDGAPGWRSDPGEPPVGPGCLAGNIVLVPTTNALHLYDAKKEGLADRIIWPDGRPMTRLATSAGDVAGICGDGVCAFGKPGAIIAAPRPAQSAGSAPPTGPARKESGQASPEEMASRFFPGIRLNPQQESARTFAGVGRSLTESPSEWVVYDSSAHKLRCVSASTAVKWETPFSGDVRSIEFDRNYAYVWCADRVEVRDMFENGKPLYSKQAQAREKPVYAEGHILLAYERDEGGSKRTHLAGFDAPAHREFDIAIGDLGLRELAAYTWDAERILLVGSAERGGRACFAVRFDADRPILEDQGRRRVAFPQAADFAHTSWFAFEGKAILATPRGDAILSWNLANGQRGWRSDIPRGLRDGSRQDTALALAGRCGSYLLWYRLPAQPRGERLFGVTDLRSGQRLCMVEAQEAVVYNGRLYTLSGSAVRAHDLRSGQVIREIEYPPRAGKPRWLQPCGNRLVVALADESGPVRRAILQDPDLGGGVARSRDQGASRYTEIPFAADPIAVDGWLDDWDRAQPRWEEIAGWRPVLDRSGRPVFSQPSKDDFSARWRACGSEDALYLAVAVRDNHVEPNCRSDCPWIGDSIEVALSGGSLARNMPTFTLALEGPGQCWAAGPRLPADQARVRYDPIEGEIIYEMAFPWSWLRQTGVLAQPTMPASLELSMAIVVNDSDGGVLRGSLEWGEGLADSWNPSGWKTLRMRWDNRGRR